MSDTGKDPENADVVIPTEVSFGLMVFTFVADASEK
jgi:hypothetical protein